MWDSQRNLSPVVYAEDTGSKISPFRPPSEQPSQIQVFHTHCILIFARADEATDNVQGWNKFGCLKNHLERNFWRHLKVFLHLLQLSMVLWAGLIVEQTRVTQSQVSPRPYLFREHLRGRRARTGAFGRRFDTYCSLKWAAQPNAGHSLPAPARSAAVLALVKGLPKHLASIKS